MNARRTAVARPRADRAQRADRQDRIVARALGALAVRDFDAARGCAQALVRRDARNLMAWKLLGAALQGLGRADEALQVKRRVIELAPGDAEGHSNLGLALLSVGHLEPAVASLRHALSIDPSLSDAHDHLCRAWALQSRLADAVAAGQAAVALQPAVGRYRRHLADALRLAGQPGAAALQYRQALDLEPACAASTRGLATVLRVLDRQDELRALWRAVATVEGADAGLLRDAAVRLANGGDHEAAAASWRRSLERDVGSIEAWHGLGTSLGWNGQLEQAIQASRQAVACRLADPSPARPAPPDPGRIAQLGAADVEAELWRVLAALFTAGIQAYPCAGTLLGLVREGRLLAFDKDLDIGLPHVDQSAARTVLLDRGWSPVRSVERLDNPRSYRHPSIALTLDLCAFEPDPANGCAISGVWLKGQPMANNRVVEFPLDALTLQAIDRPEGRCWYPQHPERLLRATYGPHWQRPDRDFDTVVAAYNLRGLAPLTEWYGWQRLLSAWMKGRCARALAIARALQRHAPVADDLLERAASRLAAEVGVA